MNPIKIIEKYYPPDSMAYNLLIEHSKIVMKKSFDIATKVPHLNPDLKFIKEAAMLHDIGIFLTNEPAIGCYGDKPYICHGYLGRELLEKEGLMKHGLVCERHIGVGLTIKDIIERNLPVPKRDMFPLSIEEQIICFADKFFSKNPEFLIKEKPLELIRKRIARYGKDKLKKFNEWVKIFTYQ